MFAAVTNLYYTVHQIEKKKTNVLPNGKIYHITTKTHSFNNEKDLQQSIANYQKEKVNTGISKYLFSKKVGSNLFIAVLLPE
jgi:hypothetical protein